MADDFCYLGMDLYANQKLIKLMKYSNMGQGTNGGGIRKFLKIKNY